MKPVQRTLNKKSQNSEIIRIKNLKTVEEQE